MLGIGKLGNDIYQKLRKSAEFTDEEKKAIFRGLKSYEILTDYMQNGSDLESLKEAYDKYAVISNEDILGRNGFLNDSNECIERE